MAKKDFTHGLYCSKKKGFRSCLYRRFIWKALRGKGIPEGYVTVIQDMYQDVNITTRPDRSQRTVLVHVGMHQGTALNLLPFTVIRDYFIITAKTEAPWTLFYADCVVLVYTKIKISFHKNRRLDFWKDEGSIEIAWPQNQSLED